MYTKVVYVKVYILTMLVNISRGIQWPSNCKTNQYYEPSELACQTCPANISLVPTHDGFACTCQPNSVPSGIARCKPCNATEMVSSDGRSCVPRRCQVVSGRVVCRKCPADHVSVTQNFDGSPMKEVACVKCARGYRAENNACVFCEACACAKSEVIVRGRCLPKRFVSDRPKHDGTRMHPNALLDVVKNEYLCNQNDVLACRQLADQCVRSFYLTDLAGPCRYWVQTKIVPPKSLPPLTIETTATEKSPGEFSLPRGMTNLKMILIAYTKEGGMRFIENPNQRESWCFMPSDIVIGRDYMTECKLNLTVVNKYFNETYSVFLNQTGELKPLPVVLRKPDEQYVQKDKWPSSKFRRFFLIDNQLSIVNNMTNTVYLRTLIVRIGIERDKSKWSSLRAKVVIEAQYATKSPLSQVVLTTMKVENDMPSAGVLRGLEIWGGVLGAFLALYGVVQWRGHLRRGGLQVSLLPILAGSIADTLYFAALFSTLHALAAEAGTLGMTLPLSKTEEYMIKTFVFSAIALKALKVAWINWVQCQCDIFFLNWAEYNPPLKLEPTMKPYRSSSWRAMALAREWSSLQTKRRACPGYTVTLALVILQLLLPWQSYLPESQSYTWAVATLSWWCAYIAALAGRWVCDRAFGSPMDALPKVCAGTGLSLIVFQEEFYAHCVHGRNPEDEGRSLAGSLETCRLVCAPQLRNVYRQLSSPTLGGSGDPEGRQALLSRFLAAFFERALDGLSWVASERTVLERLFDVELQDREAGNTSTLLYDPRNTAASCCNLTWWGEEWTLGTFDATLFGCIMIVTANSLLSALVTVVAWQVLKIMRSLLGDKNQREKTNVDII